MSATYRSQATTDGADATSVVVTKPSGTVDDDVMVAWIWSGNESITSAPSGWTLIGEQAWFGGKKCTYYWKVAASEGANYTWQTGATTWLAGTIMSYQDAGGVDVTSSGYEQASAAGALTPATGVTSTVDGCTIVMMAAGEANVTDVIADSSPAATQRAEWETTGVLNITFFAQDYLQTSAGAVTLGITGWENDGLCSYAHVAIEPAGASPASASYFTLLGIG